MIAHEEMSDHRKELLKVWKGKLMDCLTMAPEYQKKEALTDCCDGTIQALLTKDATDIELQILHRISLQQLFVIISQPLEPQEFPSGCKQPA